MSSERPRHVCASCGSVDDDLGRYIEQLEAERDEQKTLATTMARKFQHLERTIAATDGKSKNGQAATRILELWRDTCVSTKGQPQTEIIPGGTRHKWVVTRLNSPGVNEEKCLKAVQGLARFPCTKQGSPFEGMRAYHPGCALHGTCQDGGAKWADIKHALKDDERIELLGRLAELDVSRLEQPAKATVDETVAMRRVQRYERRRDPTPPIDKVLDALSARNLWWRAGAADSWSACCPAHEDRDPSLSIQRRHDGTVLLHCFAGCHTEHVVQALGLQMTDLFDDADRDTGALMALWRDKAAA